MAGTLEQLNALAGAVPGLNKQAADQAEAARRIQLQQQVARAPAAVPTAAAAQAMAPQQAAQQAQTAVAAQQTAQQQAAQIGQMALTAQGAEDKQQLAQAALTQAEEQAGAAQRQSLALSREELASRKRISQADISESNRLQKLGLDQDNHLQLLNLRQAEDLNRIGNDIKQKIFDSRMQFEKDEQGRKFSNDRQLADYTIANAKTVNEFNQRMQALEQASSRKVQLMKSAQAGVERALQQQFTMKEGKLNFEQQKELQQIRDDLAEKIREEEAAAKNRQAQWQAGGTIVGAIVGGVVGSVVPGAGTMAGAAVGAAVGGAAGTAIGGAVG